MKANEKYLVPALIRASRILELAADRGSISFADIQSELNLSKSSAYSLIQTLLHVNWLRRARENNRYSLGLQLFSWGNKALASVDIRDEAMPILRQLVDKVNQTCHLGILEGTEAVYLAKVDCSSNLIVRSWAGKRLDLQPSAMGKVLLAWKSEDEVRAILKRNKPQRYTSRAIMDIDAFITYLEEVRKNGYACDDRETTEDVFCIAAPVFSAFENDVVAAISISIPYVEFQQSEIPVLREAVCEAAQQLSRNLGYASETQGEQDGGTSTT